MYRAIVILLLAILLQGCTPVSVPDKVSRLDEAVVTEFLEDYADVLNTGEAAALKSYFLSDARLKETGASGISVEHRQSALTALTELINDHGLHVKSKVLERVVVVTDSDKATVEQRTIETWLFKERFNDFSVEVISRINIVLDDQIPRIASSNRRVVSLTSLSSQRQENLNNTLLEPL